MPEKVQSSTKDVKSEVKPKVVKEQERKVESEAKKHVEAKKEIKVVEQPKVIEQPKSEVK